MISSTGVVVNIALNAVLIFGLWWMLDGKANRHTANDNTSGVAAVMELMARLPEEQRSKAAFILFDNEEKGMLGYSAAFMMVLLALGIVIFNRVQKTFMDTV